MNASTLGRRPGSAAFHDLDDLADLDANDAEAPLLAAEIAVVEAECRALLQPCPATRTAVRAALVVLNRIAINRPQIGTAR